MEKHKPVAPALVQKTAGIMLFLGLVVFLCVRFYTANIGSFPSHIHAWAQSDRYALALNFRQNGFDLFHPRTFNLNPQFPPKVPLSVEKGITQVDCPVHEYIIALIMAATGSHSPFVFRLYNLLLGLLGLFFLFLMVRNNTLSHLKAIAVVVFAFLSPVFVYYLDGFLPSVSSVACTLIGFYFYFGYLSHQKFRSLTVAVLFLLLAALSRTPFAMFLGSVFCQIVFNMIKSKKLNLKTLLPFVIAFAVLLGYFIYNRYLARVYGSVFLSTIKPVGSLHELRENLAFIYHSWFRSYFTLYHYIAFGVLAIAFVIQWIRLRSLTVFQKNLLFHFVVTTLGATAYFILMNGQFHSHDYYFLDSFYIPALLFFILCIDSFRLQKTYAKLLFAFPLLIFVSVAFGACQTDMAFRYTENPNDRYFAESENYSHSAQLLDSLHIASNAKMLVMDAYSANIPFIRMNRTGYALIGATTQHLKESLGWNFDYATAQNEFLLSDIVNYYPDIINELTPVGNNGKITVFKKEHKPKSLPEFLQMSDKVVFYASSCTIQTDSYTDCIARNISCDSVLKIGCGNEYSNLLEIDLSLYNAKTHNLFFRADCRLNIFNNDNTDMVAAINSGTEQVYYKSFALNQYLDETSGVGFRKLYFMYPLPETGNNKGIFKLYLWNNGKNELELKNICVWMVN